MSFRQANDALGKTAGQCIEGRWCLVAHCAACKRSERFPQPRLAEFAPELPIAEIIRRLVCSACGGSEGVVGLSNADWHPGKG